MVEYRILTGVTAEELAYNVQNEINGPEMWVLRGGVSVVIRQFEFHADAYLFCQAMTRENFEK